MTFSVREQRRESQPASTEDGARQIVIIMKTQVSGVTCQLFKGMRFVT